MGPTLFRYIFRDLIRIFLITSGVLAGIMSFGGLLRPLTQHGLDLAQVGEILGYFMPAMTTYSLPIAALFATTLVYGRLGADNEIVAARAAGMSHLALALPAFVMGVVVAIVSLLLLCFVVPLFMLQAERVVFSNVARIVATAINTSHQVQLEQGIDRITVFARAARVLPDDPDRPDEQAVQLVSPTIVTFEPQNRADPNRPRVPRDFWLAQSATAYIAQSPDADELMMTAVLEGGTKFPRSLAGGVQGGVGITQFGPIPFPSLVRENTKFMDITRLLHLLREPGESRRVRQVLREFIRNEQKLLFFRQVTAELAGSEYVLGGGSESYTLRAPGATVKAGQDELTVTCPPGGPRAIRLTQERDGRTVLTVEARRLRLSALPDAARKQLYVTMDLQDAVVQAGQDEPALRSAFPRAVTIGMTSELLDLEERDAQFYAENDQVLPEQHRTLRRALVVLRNGILSETHARASFAVSCWILVMVGCALGMMFRSGNFLSAFAVSVVPALVCIALIVTGQQTCENVPRDLARYGNPINLGLALIWSGNAAILILATVLLGRLQRQ